MARKELIKTNLHPYHVTARTNNKEFFPLEMHECWRLYNYYLQNTINKYQLDIHAFVLMSNHFHLILSTPKENLDVAMGHFLTTTSKGVGLKCGKMNHLYGGPYKWKLLDSPTSFAMMYKYLYRNPVRAGICERVEEYFWSTLNAPNLTYSITMAESHSEFIPLNYNEMIEWLNEPTPAEATVQIKKSLQRNGIFKAIKDPITKFSIQK